MVSKPARPRTETAEDQARADRRRARRRWPMHRYDLGDQPSDDLTTYTSGADRLAMVWPLTVTSWALAGRQIPDYERESAPGTLHRSGDPD